MQLPPRATLFPYTTLFRSALASVAPSVPWPARPFDLSTRGNLRESALDARVPGPGRDDALAGLRRGGRGALRSEEHTSELQSRGHLVCRLLLEKKNYNLVN